jgi:hypothetical protein
MSARPRAVVGLIVSHLTLITFSGCASAPAIWDDFTGQGRDNPSLQMDVAQCDMYASERTSQVQFPVVSPTAASFAAAVIATSNYRQNAWEQCMRSKGWARHN